MSFFKLPRELVHHIASELTLKERIALYSTSSEGRNFIQHNEFQRDKFWSELGAKNYNDFQQRMGKLPKRLQNEVLDEVISLKTAEILKVKKPEERLPMLSIGERGRIKNGTSSEYLKSDFETRLVCERIISSDNIREINRKHEDVMSTLRNNSSVIMPALRKKLLTFDDLVEMGSMRLGMLTMKENKNGMKLLHEKLVTPKELASMNDMTILYLGRDDNGITALRNKLITVEEIKKIDFSKLPEELENRVHAFKQESTDPGRKGPGK